jgi:hypothetical protein
MTKSIGNHPVAVAGLKRKRREIAGIVADLEKQIARHRASLAQIDQVLLLMDPTLPIEAIAARKARPRNTGPFAHSELSRRVYEALRDRDTVSAAELADAALRDKGYDDKRMRAEFISKFLVRLAQMASAGRVERIWHGNGVRWRLRQ